MFIYTSVLYNTVQIRDSATITNSKIPTKY